MGILHKHLSRMYRPTLSVIVSTKNRLTSLRECVESLLLDKFPKQIIIQDGASTDGTVEFLKSQKRILWKSEADTCHVDGLRKALKRATGKFVLILGDDDMVIPGSIAPFIQRIFDYEQSSQNFKSMF